MDETGNTIIVAKKKGSNRKSIKKISNEGFSTGRKSVKIQKALKEKLENDINKKIENAWNWND